MPPAGTIEAPERTKAAKESKHAGKNYRVVKPFGPWTDKDLSIGGRPNVFDLPEFVRLHPLPATKDKDGNAIAQQFDHATYHDDLLDRGLALGVIVHAPEAELTDTPLGPTNGKGKFNPIKASTDQAIADRKLRESIASSGGKASEQRIEQMARMAM